MNATRLLMVPCVGLALSACDQPRSKAERKHYIAEQAKLEQIIDLPGGQGTVHVLRVPTGFMEASRCVVVTSPAGGPAVSCVPKDFDMTDADGR